MTNLAIENLLVENAKARKATGTHFTPELLAQFVAERIVEEIGEFPERRLKVLDPAVGNGSLLEALVDQVMEIQRNKLSVWGVDTNPKSIAQAHERLTTAFPRLETSIFQQNFLDMVVSQNPLFQMGKLEEHDGSFDIVIANPPYVRTQQIGAAVSQKLAEDFGLSGHVDLYHVFIEAIARVLRPRGVAGLIVSNRFMTTQSGAAIRKCIRNNFDLVHVWDLGDTKLFEAAVLPAVLLLKRVEEPLEADTGRFTSVYSVKQGQAKMIVPNVFVAIEEDTIFEVPNVGKFQIQQGKLDTGSVESDVWRISTKKKDSWLREVEKHTDRTFGDVGKIRVGVKTTADKVFIRSDWESECGTAVPELLKPLTTHHIARRFKAQKPKKRILYTHHVIEGKRSAVDLRQFPRTTTYLEKNRERLEARKYVTSAGREWFEIWVPQDPDSWQQPKLVFRDIAEEPTFWLDFDGTVVNGDCYWMTNDHEGPDDWMWLALAVGNSNFIEKFYDHRFNNKLYAGRRRFITQYVEKFPLPDMALPVSREIVELTKAIYGSVGANSIKVKEVKLNELVWRAFGVK